MSSIPIDHLGRDDLITLLNLESQPDLLLFLTTIPWWVRHRLPSAMDIAILCHQMTSSDLQWLHIGIGHRGMRRSTILGTHIYAVQTVRPRLVLFHIRAKQVHRHIPLTVGVIVSLETRQLPRVSLMQ